VPAELVLPRTRVADHRTGLAEDHCPNRFAAVLGRTVRTSSQTRSAGCPPSARKGTQPEAVAGIRRVTAAARDPDLRSALGRAIVTEAAPLRPIEHRRGCSSSWFVS
jgi:hypothetical protein